MDIDDDDYDEEEAMNLAIALSMEIETSTPSKEATGLLYSCSSDLTEEESIEIALALSVEEQSSTEIFDQYNNANSEDIVLKNKIISNDTKLVNDEVRKMHCNYFEPPDVQPEIQGIKCVPQLLLEDMDKPHPFIITRDDGHLEIKPNIFDYLNSVTKPLVIISVAGLYRTGKSYLLNRLLGKEVGFPLGSTVQSETKGIWIWVSPHPMDPDKVLVLLDTEGLADPEKGNATHDAQIFCLALLLSSTFVYNSKGTIDNNALHDLQMTAELSSHIKLKANSSGEETEDIEGIFPKFVWAVRDFFLKCEVNGNTVTSDEYLEWGLQRKKGHGEKISQANNVRKTIKESFRERHCFLFPFPTTPDKLQDLESLKFDQLDENFKNVSQEFTEIVLKISDPKSVLGKEVTGRMFLNLAKTYVDTINKGSVPVIENAVDYITKVENEKAKEKALEIFQSRKSGLTLPMRADELNKTISTLIREAIKTFAEFCIFDDQQVYSVQLAHELKQFEEEITNENLKCSRAVCEKIIREQFKAISMKIQNGSYLEGGGYEEYQEDYLEASQMFEACAEGQEAKDTVLQEYRENTENDKKQRILFFRSIGKTLKMTECKSSMLITKFMRKRRK